MSCLTGHTLDGWSVWLHDVAVFVLPKEITVIEVLEKQRADGRNIILNTRKSDAISTADAANEMVHPHPPPPPPQPQSLNNAVILLLVCASVLCVRALLWPQSDKDVSCVVVVDDKDKMAGIFTAKDFLRTIVIPRQDATKELVTSHMSNLAICANPSFSVLDCARLMLSQYVLPGGACKLVQSVLDGLPVWMTRRACVSVVLPLMHRNFRHLPVVDPESKQCIGVVTGTDLVRMLVPLPTVKPQARRVHDYFQLLSGRRHRAAAASATSGKTAAPTVGTDAAGSAAAAVPAVGHTVSSATAADASSAGSAYAKPAPQ